MVHGVGDIGLVASTRLDRKCVCLDEYTAVVCLRVVLLLIDAVKIAPHRSVTCEQRHLHRLDSMMVRLMYNTAHIKARITPERISCRSRSPLRTMSEHVNAMQIVQRDLPKWDQVLQSTTHGTASSRSETLLHRTKSSCRGKDIICSKVEVPV